MSLSDKETEEFKPFDPKSLDTYDQEQFNRTEKTRPDFNRFQMLFEPKLFEKEEPVEFKSLYNGKKEREKFVFKPMIDTGEQEDQKEPDVSEPQPPPDTSEETLPPEETPEEKGYKQGYDNGFSEGMEQGREKGYKQGIEEGRAEGFEKGQADGFEAGEKEGFEVGEKAGAERAEKEAKENAEKILASLQEIFGTVEMLVPNLVDKYENRLLNLIEKITQKAVMAIIETDDEIVRPMILDALKLLVEPEQVVLRVSPEDYQYVEMVKDDFFEQVESLENISVMSDPSVDRGGCRVDTSTASVTCDPMDRLDAIFEAIKAAGSR